MQVKGLIFDMDGTLLDSMAYWHGLAGIFLRFNGLTPKEEGLDDKVYDMGIGEMMDFFKREYGLSYPSVKAFKDAYYAAIEPYYRDVIQPKEDALAFLEAAKAHGLKLCIATATRTSTGLLALERLGFLPYIEFVLCCADVGVGKEKPDIYLKAAEKMGLSVEECIVFEDALYCVKTAKAAGFKVVGVWDRPAARDEKEIAALSDRYIRGYRELLEQ